MCGRVLRKCLHIDVVEHHVVQDVDSVDLVELADAVAELEQWGVVDCHPERLVCAQDLHLENSSESTSIKIMFIMSF